MRNLNAIFELWNAPIASRKSAAPQGRRLGHLESNGALSAAFWPIRHLSLSHPEVELFVGILLVRLREQGKVKFLLVISEAGIEGGDGWPAEGRRGLT